MRRSFSVPSSSAAMISLSWQDCCISCNSPCSKSAALTSISLACVGPQKGSLSSAFRSDERQKSKRGRFRLLACLRRDLERRQATSTSLMVGSDSRTKVTAQAGSCELIGKTLRLGSLPGHPRVEHQSSSSPIRHCNHEKAPPASPVNASSRSMMLLEQRND